MATLIRVIGTLIVYMTCLVAVNASTRTIAVTNSQCGRKHTIDEETLLVYSGDDLSFPCEIELDGSLDGVCVTATTYDVTCNIQVEYHGGLVISGYADKEVGCSSPNPKKKYCTSFSTLTVVFDNTGSRYAYKGTTTILKVEKKSDISDAISEAYGAVVGTIVGLLVLSGIMSVIVVVVCYKRKRRLAAGMVYNNAPQIQTTVVSQGQYPQGTAYPTPPFPQQQYPAPQQYNMQGNQPAGPQQQYNMQGYQPYGPQQHYNMPGNQPTGPQYPAPGNQPMNYGQPLSGFPSPTGDNGAGYQPAVPPPYDETEKLTASAPTMPGDFNTSPPAYPGN